MSSRRHKLHKSIKNKSRRLGKKGGSFYAMLGRSAIRTGSSFGTLGAKIVVPLILRGFEPPLKPEQRKTAVKYFNKFANAANGFIQHNVTAAGTKKLMDAITHPEVVAASIAKKVSDKTDALKAKYSDPAEREKLLASAKASASSAAASAKEAASKIAESDQFKAVKASASSAAASAKEAASKLAESDQFKAAKASTTAALKNVTNSEQFKSASAAATSAVKSEQFQKLSSSAKEAANKASIAATTSFNKPASGGRSKKSTQKTIKKTKNRKVRKSIKNKKK